MDIWSETTTKSHDFNKEMHFGVKIGLGWWQCCVFCFQLWFVVSLFFCLPFGTICILYVYFLSLCNTLLIYLLILPIKEKKNKKTGLGWWFGMRNSGDGECYFVFSKSGSILSCLKDTLWMITRCLWGMQGCYGKLNL